MGDPVLFEHDWRWNTLNREIAYDNIDTVG